jgi:hypothetical protein
VDIVRRFSYYLLVTMSDQDECEKPVQQVLLLSENSEDRTILEMPHKRKMTFSHINRKLEDYHGEIKSKQQTLIKWIVKEKHEKELR